MKSGKKPEHITDIVFDRKNQRKLSATWNYYSRFGIPPLKTQMASLIDYQLNRNSASNDDKEEFRK